MTIRLYYDDPYSREFDATVVRVEPRGDHHAVWLDRSSFYPTSGGQPFDIGLIEQCAVVDVVDEDGDVVHIVARGGAFAPGTQVHGTIDWARRFDHMQQHTGQHLLSAAFVRTAQVPTVSFHMGSEVSTIDLARDVSAEQVARAEDEANAIVWENRAVSISYADASDAATMGLRKEPMRTGTLRLITIDDFDRSACGGSHVNRTGAVGVIAITGWERFKGGLRVEFACGSRAVRRHRLLRDTVTASVRHLSVLLHELPGAIERLQADQRQSKKVATEYERVLARYRGEELAGVAESVAGIRLVVAVVASDAAALKAVASVIVAKPGHVAVLASAAAPVSIVAMRAANVPMPCDALVKTLCHRFGGRGGGTPEFAQAGGLSGSVDEMAAEAKALAIAALS